MHPVQLCPEAHQVIEVPSCDGFLSSNYYNRVWDRSKRAGAPWCEGSPARNLRRVGECAAEQLPQSVFADSSLKFVIGVIGRRSCSCAGRSY